MTIPIIPQTAPDDGELDFDGLTLQDKLVMLIIVRFMHEENGNATMEYMRETAKLYMVGYRAWGEEFDQEVEAATEHIKRRRALARQQSGGQTDPRPCGAPAHKLPRLTGPLWEVY